MLIPFWFNVTKGLGFGVTASTEAEAEQLLRQFGYPPKEVQFTNVVQNITFAELDQKHVVPNSGPMVVRGVWYPRHNV
ncbi:hypothetical protein HDE80_003568 [Rhodanobacter sp. A1T4]|nr:hypothetical protein [Rhodanobacter sp. A1T4]